MEGLWKDYTQSKSLKFNKIKALFTADTYFQMPTDEFLSNKKRNSRFILILSESLYERGIEVIQAVCSADVKIIKTTAEKSYILLIVEVGDGTNLLILLLFHTNCHFNKIYC